MSTKSKTALSLAIILFVIIVDQIVKVAVKTNMSLYENIDITPWFKLRFIENNGMAFGWELFGKYFLTSFRIVAIGFITWILTRAIRRQASTYMIVCLSLVVAGATGNVIDCLFYGLIFNDPPYGQVAEFVGWGNGYGSFMLGRVVDMFYFPLFEWNAPQWPWLNSVSFLPDAGEHCVFFSAIFNVADAAVSCAVIALIGKFLTNPKERSLVF